MSITGVLWLAGLYLSSVSSCMGSLYGPPRILQSIANENVIPVVRFLGHGVSNFLSFTEMSDVFCTLLSFRCLNEVLSYG